MNISNATWRQQERKKYNIYVMTLTLLTLLQIPNLRGRRARSASHRCWLGTNISAGNGALSSSGTHNIKKRKLWIEIKSSERELSIALPNVLMRVLLCDTSSLFWGGIKAHFYGIYKNNFCCCARLFLRTCGDLGMSLEILRLWSSFASF